MVKYEIGAMYFYGKLILAVLSSAKKYNIAMVDGIINATDGLAFCYSWHI
jgi:hypothetical protein